MKRFFSRLAFSAACFLAAHAGAADKPLKVGIAMYTLSVHYFVAQQQAAEKMGCTVVTTDGQNDMMKQDLRRGGHALTRHQRVDLKRA